MTDPAQGPSYDARYGPAAPNYAPPGPARRTNSLAVISLVAGLCGFTLVPFLGSIIAVITGHLALGQIRATGEDGRTLATAGLWLGYIAIALAILAVVGFLLFVVVAASTSTSY